MRVYEDAQYIKQMNMALLRLKETKEFHYTRTHLRDFKEHYFKVPISPVF